jgi:uncharacterized repeat protein (TIGR03803 family)
VVFKLTPTGQETVLHSFAGGSNDGAYPLGGVIIDASGNLYGTTQNGGASGKGVVFRLSPKGRETVLYSFTGGSDGGSPNAGLTRDANGNLYGTAVSGGVGAGVVFKVSPRGKETVLYSFTGGNDGANPVADLIRDANGNLYGTTFAGGADGKGVVFKLSPRGREVVLHSFAGGIDGAYSESGLLTDANGNLYGVTLDGGGDNNGVVFKLTPRGRETVLYSFTGRSDGGTPQSVLIMDTNGNLYGTTVQGGEANTGVVFEVRNRAQPANP